MFSLWQVIRASEPEQRIIRRNEGVRQQKAGSIFPPDPANVSFAFI
jgi:hypothetical protein